MFEIARVTMYKEEQDAQALKENIISLLISYNFSLSQTRALFHEIINNLEDAPLK